ncbi:histone deacetylase [bacterium]|nr:histone deacetylase [bacterium]
MILKVKIVMINRNKHSFLSQIDNVSWWKKIYKTVYKNINIVYSKDYDSYFDIGAYFDTGKFRKIVKELSKDHLFTFREMIHPTEVDDQSILSVHTEEYFDWIKMPLNLREVLSSTQISELDTDAFQTFRYIAGGSCLGLKLAYTTKKITFNLSGGYHHALPDKGYGFCPINDIAIAVKNLKKNFGVKNILIIDLDYHQGNGTKDIFLNDSTTFTLSIHANEWDSRSGVANMDIEIPTTIDDDYYLMILMDSLHYLDHIFIPEAIVYVAGSDPFVKDELCDMSLSEEGMLRRDIMVYNFAKKRDIPILVLPAGGYGRESWRIYYNFIKWVLFNG